MSPSGLPLRPDIASIAARRGLLPPGGRANVLVQPWTYYHRRDVPAAGASSFTFFNEPKSQGVTNLENQGSLPANQVLEVHGMRFGFLPGIDRLGNRLGVAAPTQAQIEASLLNRASTIASSADPASPLVLWNEKARELLNQGSIQLTVNSRVLVDTYALTTFPESKGVVSDANGYIAATFTAAAGLASIRSGVFNGAPAASNERKFPTKVAIFPGQAFSVAVNFNRAVDFTQQYAGPLYNVSGAVTAGVLCCELFGNLIVNVS